jgi:MFS family permease
VTYLYAGITELFIRIPRGERTSVQREREKLHPWHRFRLELAEGLRYLKGERGLLTLVIVYAVLNFLISPVLVTLPFFATDFLGLSAAWYGYLMAAFGLGAVLGYIVAGAFPTRGRARELAVNVSLAVQTVLTLVALVFKAPAAELAIFLVIGLTGGVMNVNINTLIQLSVPPDYMGRVQGIMTTICAGAMPLGMALSGFLFDLSGQNVSLLFIVSGVASLVAVVAALMVKDYRKYLASK